MVYGVYVKPINSVTLPIKLKQLNVSTISYQMKFMFCVLDYVGKHSIYVLSATKSIDTIVLMLKRLVDRVDKRSGQKTLFSNLLPRNTTPKSVGTGDCTTNFENGNSGASTFMNLGFFWGNFLISAC